MNEQLQSYARNALLEGLHQLPESHQDFFKLMYGRDDGKRSVEDAKAIPIKDVVAAMPDSKLDWAIRQVQNSIDKIHKQAEAAKAGL